MMALSKLLAAVGLVVSAIGGSYLGPAMGAAVAAAVFNPPPAQASDWTGKINPWPQNESLLGTATKSVPYITKGLNGGNLRQAVTWVGTETIQREDGTCYTITREKLHITPQGTAQRVTVQETIERVECPTLQGQQP